MKRPTPLDPELQAELGHHGPKARDYDKTVLRTPDEVCRDWFDHLREAVESAGSANIA